MTARHPMATDAGIAVAVAAANVPQTVGADVAAGGWLWFAAVHLPLLWRRRAPTAALWTVLALVAAAWFAGPGGLTYPVVVALAAVYAAARFRPWKRWWAGVAALEAAFVAAALQGDLGRTDLVALSFALAAVALSGTALRSHYAHRADLAERDRQRAGLALAAERNRIAAELHDIISHNMAVMVALADGAGLTAADSPKRAAETLGTIADTGRQCLDEMHRLVTVLRGDETDSETTLAPQPGVDQLDELLERVGDTGLRVRLERGGTPVRCGAGLSLTVYRLVQEALTNTLAHAGPSASATVRLEYGEGHIDLRVTDRGGRPPGPAPHGRGRGLTGMAERAAAYGGRLEAGPLPDGGWEVRTRLLIVDRRSA
ncbi:sensor histidine kinase [Glycomyces tenuis]|uniref:sensor histidine kinase n=1 Tax=Glycomyces tenuis TaxID=58116 RepID=UPI00138B11A6|nr:histidine kinase [Glycomyces tenuis]